VNSFQQFLFRDAGRISIHASESKRSPHMAHILASYQASFINFSGEPASSRSVSF
jgi:hypothetical protein